MGRRTGLYTKLTELVDELRTAEHPRAIILGKGVRAAKLVAKELLGTEHPGHYWFPILHAVLKLWFDKVLRPIVREGKRVPKLPEPEEFARLVLTTYKDEFIKLLEDYAKAHPRFAKYVEDLIARARKTAAV